MFLNNVIKHLTKCSVITKYSASFCEEPVRTMLKYGKNIKTRHNLHEFPSDEKEWATHSCGWKIKDYLFVLLAYPKFQRMVSMRLNTDFFFFSLGCTDFSPLA